MKQELLTEAAEIDYEIADRVSNGEAGSYQEQRPCKLCGTALVFAQSADGALIPLDRRAPVYKLVRDDQSGQLRAVRDVTCFVSHFCTCQRIDQLKRAQKK